MAKTGEHSAAARHQLLVRAQSDPKAPPPPEPAAGPTSEPVTPVAPPAESAAELVPAEPASEAPRSSTPASSGESAAATPFRGDRKNSDEVLAARTGHTWGEWFALLDAWGAVERPHPEIARWLNSEHGVPGWWAQEVTVGYEMAIGRRRPGEGSDGFSVSASKTVGVPVERLFAAVVDDDIREVWLLGASIRVRTATPYRTARFDWADGSSRLAVGFTAKGEARSTVAMEHERLPNTETAEQMKAFWRERLTVLQRLLESQADAAAGGDSA
jgi:hypothetical protein